MVISRSELDQLQKELVSFVNQVNREGNLGSAWFRIDYYTAEEDKGREISTSSSFFGKVLKADEEVEE